MKNKQEWILENYSLFWVILIILILVLVFVGYRMINHNSFTIYKDECRNEIQEIGLDYYNEKSYGENYNIISYEIKIKDFGFYKLDDDFCIDYISSQTNKSFILISSEFYDKGVGLECIGREITSINKNYYNISSKIEYLISVEEAKEIFPELNFDKSKVYIKNGAIYNKNKYFWVVIDVIRNKSICEKVGVEEIYLGCFNPLGETMDCNAVPEVTPPYKEETQKKGDIDRTRIIHCENNECKAFLVESINKKDLTKEWLDENCGCLECKDSRETTANKRQQNKVICEYSSCYIYKCFENYYVELK